MAEVPVNNGAPAGRYSVVVRFVVDIDGSISNIQALTNHGYGLEEEAIRVIKKSKKWGPAYLNGSHVKAYKKQVIIALGMNVCGKLIVQNRAQQSQK